MFILQTNFCESAGFIFSIIAEVINIIRWIVPLAIVVLVSIDVFKALTAQKAEDTKELFNKEATRLVFAILIFIVPSLYRFIFNTLISVDDDQKLTGTKAVLACLAEKF